MDCDDVILLFATERTLTGVEAASLHEHLNTCEACRELSHGEAEDPSWRWVARLPDDAFDDPDLLALPVVDPIVFAAGEEIASGGMGKITRARDRRLGREVAIKEVLEPELRARFEREATITARLQHPAIVPIYEAGTWPNGSAFYTMRLVAGGTLSQAIKAATTLPERLALLPHVVAVTDALAYAHSRHIIHRDLKPQNVLVGEFGETVVIDWGLAKELDHEIDAAAPVRAGIAPELTLAGAVIGTPCFMPPEQARGEDLDERADVFALGAILYNVLAGEPPYWDQPRETSQQLLDAVLARPPTPIGEKAPDAPADLRAVVERAMMRDPAARYANAKEMAEELRRFQAGQLLVSREYRIRDLVLRWIVRHKTPVVVAAIAVVALAIVGVLAVVNVTRSRDAERDARVVAERAGHETDRSIAGLLEEQGRSELVAGQRERALAYLAEAYRRGRDTPALRYLLAEATRDLDLLTGTITGAGDPDLGDAVYRRVAFLPDGKLAVLAPPDALELYAGTKRVQRYAIGPIEYGEFSPDGRRLVVTDTGAATRAYDVATGAKLWETRAGTTLVDGVMMADEADAIAFDPGSTRVALYPRFGGAEIFELDTGKRFLAIDRKYRVTSVAFDASGGVIVAIGAGGLCTFFAWEPKSRTWTTVPFGKTGFDFADAGFVGEKTEDRIVMTTRNREVLLWTLEHPFHAIGGHRAEITAVGAASVDRWFATGDASGAVKLWGYNGELYGENDDMKQAVRGLVFSHDASMLVGFGDDPHVRVWNTALGTRGVLLAHGDEFESVEAVAFAQDDSQLATVDSTGDRVRMWKPPHSNRLVYHKGTAVAVGTHVGATVARDQLVVFELATGSIVKQLVIPQPPGLPSRGDVVRSELSISLDGRRGLVASSGDAMIYDLGAAKLERQLAHDPQNDPTQLAWQLAPSGRYALELGDKRLRLHDAATGNLLIDVATDDGRFAALSPDEKRLVQAATTPRAWQVPSGTPIAMPVLPIDTLESMHDGREVEITPTPDDLVWAQGGQRFVVLGLVAPLVVDAATGKTVSHLALASVTHDIYTAKLDAKGQRVVTQTGDVALVWNADTGALLFQIPDTAAHAVAISANGDRIATGSTNGTIRIWDATGRLLDTLHGQSDAIVSLDFGQSDDRLVALGSLDQVTVWDVHLEQRSPAKLAEVAAAATPWQVVGGMLVMRNAK